MGKYITVGGQKLHFQLLGEGPALVMLHPSPHSSELLMPLAKLLSTNYTVICIDTPGYGYSDPLPNAPSGLEDYAEVLHRAFIGMGIDRLSFYGSATGAQIAIRYSLMYPDSVSHLFLDNAAHFGEAWVEKTIPHYFPDLTPQSDGSHLPKIWQMVNQMFQYFPWCFTTPEYALDRPQLPPEVLNGIALDFLRTGKGYSTAYKPAFYHENATFVKQLRVPTSIFNWTGSIVTKYIDALLAFDLPKNAQGIHIEGSPNVRMEEMSKYINEKAENASPYGPSKAIKDYQKITPSYETGSEIRPAIIADGTHFNAAWKLLVKYNPKRQAEAIQAYLAHWYTT